MRNTQFTICAALVLLFVFAGDSRADYSGGSGDEAEPYQITTIADWQNLMDTPTDWDKHFILTADLNLQDVPLSPVGNEPNMFTGVFDGNDHIIRNIDINTPDENYVGLFGYVGGDGNIRNVGIEDAEIRGYSYVGGLAGINLGIIADCQAIASVVGRYRVGGLVGRNNGTIVDCSAIASAISLHRYVGGLVGVNHGEIGGCYASGSAGGVTHVGGLVGEGWSGIVANCYATSSVSGEGGIGGLVGSNSYGSITNCYATGPVDGNSDVGGLVGFSRSCSITNCYASGSVSGEDNCSGLVGRDNRNVTINACFWNVETSGQSGNVGGKGLTTGQMKSLIIFRNAGWAGEGWVIADGLDYPRLEWEETAGVPIPDPEPVPFLGAGTEEDPYQVWTPGDFALLSWHTALLSKHIELMADLDVAGLRLYPIGDLGLFTGVFDGSGHIISNAHINMPNSGYVGLFGYTGSDAIIRNIGIEHAEIIGDYCVGGLLGRNYGTISNSYAEGSVSGDSCLGGLVGANSDGSISNSYAEGSVSGDSSLGGLVGVNNDGSISNCYSAGLVNGDADVGGLVGDCDDENNITASFWDIETSGQPVSAGGRGLTTSQMKSATIYGYIGWSGEVWVIADGLDYPRLAWEGTGGTPLPDPEPVPLPGAGTEDDPYQVWTADDFALLSWHVSVLDRYIELMADLDLTGIALDPIGEFSPFTGVFDGNDHVIRNVDINMADRDYVGLFGNIDPGGTIQNVGIENAEIMGNGYVGILAGRNAGTIANCWVTGSVSGSDYFVGGLVGLNDDASISNSFATALVTGSRIVGGLVGDNYCGSITDCYATGPVNATSRAGGLVGLNWWPGIITYSYATGLVNGEDEIGGLVGDNYGGKIRYCYAVGSVAGSEDVGGLVGDNADEADINYSCATGSVSGILHVGGLVGSNSDGDISNCYATGSISGDSFVGGLVGIHGSGYVRQCYATGSVTGIHSSVGGLMGESYNANINYFLHPDDGGGPDNWSGIPLTDTQMRQEVSFVGWDFVGEEVNGTDDIWSICEGTNYPRFTWQIPPADWLCPDGVAFEDFSHFANLWATLDVGENPVNLDGQDGVGFGDLMIFCQQWLTGR